MKTTTLVALLGALLVTVAAPAATAADTFSRFYVQGGFGQKSVNVESSVSGPGGAGTINLGDNSMFGQVAGGYNLAVSENVRIGFGAFYDVGAAKGGTVTGTIGGVSATYLVKERSHYGISFEPGYAFAKDSIAYAKITFNWMRAEHTLGGATVAADATTFSTIGYGVGLKHMVGNTTYLFAEWQKVQYNVKPFDDGVGDTISYKPSENFGLLGVGLTF